tara:strand:+ start:831 stop:1439 length:609 start_codon:yes stop_codon:yes gene_type:complete
MKIETFDLDTSEKNWVDYDWTRIKCLLPQKDLPVKGETTLLPERVYDKKDLIQILKRRSLKSFSAQKIEPELFEKIKTCLDGQKDRFPWLDYRIINHETEGVQKEISPIIQKQWWTKSNHGLSLFYIVNWEKAIEELDSKNGHHTLWIILGQVGEQLLELVTCLGLKARMTPAISESLGKKILQLENPHEDPVYYFRVGHGK